MAQTELKEALGEAIARLPEREKLVVTLYYYEELTLREIGEVLGVTESRVSQLHTKAILRLKARLSATRAGVDPRTSPDAGPFFLHVATKSLNSPGSTLAEETVSSRFSTIRNVAVVGHRGTGKTSLVEAMLFQSGATNRLGTVEGESTVSDWDEDEHRARCRSRRLLCHAEWKGRKINLSTRRATRASRPTRSHRCVWSRARLRGQRGQRRRGADRRGSGSAPTRSASAASSS